MSSSDIVDAGLRAVRTVLAHAGREGRAVRVVVLEPRDREGHFITSVGEVAHLSPEEVVLRGVEGVRRKVIAIRSVVRVEPVAANVAGAS